MTKHTPKFFDKELTGKGTTNGVITRDVNPLAVGSNVEAFATQPSPDNHAIRRAGDIRNHVIPLSTLVDDAVVAPCAHLHLDTGLMHPITVHGNRLHIGLTPQWANLRITASSTRELQITYRLEILRDGVTSTPVAAQRYDASQPPTDPAVPLVVTWTRNPLRALQQVLDDERWYAARLSDEDVSGLIAWMDEYPLYTRLCELAARWSGDDVIDDVAALVRNRSTPQTQADADYWQALITTQVRYLSSYAVSLESYRHLYEMLREHLDPATLSEISQTNLDLLIAKIQDDLAGVRDQLEPLPRTSNYVALPTLTSQQQEIITSADPLVMVRAGAGTGKSFTVMQAIDYRTQGTDVKVNEEEVTILSFTNAAANNIKQRRPSLNSMTIDSMMLAIYQHNFPDHRMCSTRTVMNALDIFASDDLVAQELKTHLRAMDRNVRNAYTEACRFIETHYDHIVGLLDLIGKTTQDLKSIICYLRIDDLEEPPETKTRHLIVDEVQDNSIFQFIYILRYVIKTKCSLMIVGDPSQTLYEFRSSNPKALNALESAKVFTTYRLEVNHRSCQEVLDLGNAMLSDVEANVLAGIQLRANEPRVPTVGSTKYAVPFETHRISRIYNLRNDIPALIMGPACDFTRECMDAGEQTAFLAYSRAHVETMEETLRRMFPMASIASLVAPRHYETSIFSEFVKKYWRAIEATNPAHAAYILTQQVRSTLPTLDPSFATIEDKVADMLAEWWKASETTIRQDLHLYYNKQINKATFFDRLKRGFLAFEIDRDQQLMLQASTRNDEMRQQIMETRPDLLVSTIHSAKGLEFDNVVLLHQDAEMTSFTEENKRLYYVGVTRAKKRCFVLSVASASVKRPYLATRHTLLMDALAARDAGKPTPAKNPIELVDPSEQDMVARYVAAERDVQHVRHDTSVSQ